MKPEVFKIEGNAELLGYVRFLNWLIVHVGT